MTPEEEESILRSVGQGTLSALSMFGNALDLPGSMVRDVLAWENPLDQILSPLSGENRVTGRELLTDWGLTRPNDPDRWEAADFFGFGAEVLTDPLAFVSLGGSALGKGGQVAKRAGLLDDVAKVAPQLGKRQGRMKSTLDDVLSLGGMDEQMAKHQRAKDAAEAMGLRLEDVAEEPLGGLVGFGLPFRDPVATIGSGPLSQGIAGGMDTVASGIANSGVGRSVGALFDYTTKGTRTEKGQPLARALTRRQEHNRFTVGENIGKHAQRITDAGFGEAENADALRAALETGNDLEGLEGMSGEFAAHWQDLLRRGKQVGIPVNQLNDIIEYHPRYKTGVSRAERKARMIFGAFDPSATGREEFLKGIEGGTGTLKQIAQDPDLNALIDGGGSLDDIKEMLTAKYGPLVRDSYIEKKFTRRGDNVVHEKDITHDQHLELARWLKGMPADDRMQGVFANHPLKDARTRMLAGEDAIAAADTVLDALADPDVAGFGFEAVMKVGELFKRVGLDPGDGKTGALAELAKRRQVHAGEELLNMAVRPDVAQDLVRMTQAFKDPNYLDDVLSGFDSVTNLTKASLTAPWPAFHIRNFMSGQFRNKVAGLFSVKALKDAHSIMRGGAAKGAAAIPRIKRMLAEQGLEATDANATDMIRQLSGAGELVTRRQGEVAQRVGLADQGDSIDDLMGMFPGGLHGSQPFDFSQTAAKAVGRTDDTNLKPWDVRGVGERETTKFGPVAAGEDIGYYVEGLNRLTPFIEGLRKGWDPESLANKVRAAQIDYSGRTFTPFEHGLLRLFPFGKFLRKNTPWTIRQLYEKPGGLFPQTIRFGETFRDDDPRTPGYIREQLSIRVPENIPLFGPEPGSDPRYITGLGLMEEDAINFLGGPQDVGLELLSRTNPLLKGPLEYITGQSFFMRDADGGREMSELDPPIGRTLSNIFELDEPVDLPDAVEMLVANSPLSRVATTARTLSDPRKQDAPGAMLTNLLSGVKMTDVSKKQRNAVVEEATKSLLGEMDGTRTFNNMYIPEAVREAMPADEREQAERFLALLRLMRQRARHPEKE